MDELVLLDTYDDGVHVLKLNRPEKLNALSIELRETVADRVGPLADDRECRGLVLTGEGPAFCAGMDFTQFGGGPENKEKLFAATKGIFSSLLDFPKPLVGAINGAAVGGGFMLALTCDERIASPRAFFGFYEVRRGIPAPYHIMRLFVDESRARDWCETGRKVGVDEALDAGIVKDIVSFGDLVDASRKEARSRVGARRQVDPEVRSAFEESLSVFRKALFPEE